MTAKQQLNKKINKKVFLQLMGVLGAVGVVGLMLGAGPWLKSYLAFSLIDQQIKQLPPSQKTAAEDYFYASPAETDFFAGTVARIKTSGGKGENSELQGQIWVWSNLGPRAFRVTPETKLYYYDVCRAYREFVANSTSEAVMRVDAQVRRQAKDLGEWREWVESGSFVQLEVGRVEGSSANEASGEGRSGESRSGEQKIISISAYDQPLFLSLDLARVCGG